jgi:hypothetical protein
LYHITGLHAAEILDVSERVHQVAQRSERTWPPALGLHESVVITSAYVRRDRVRAGLAEAYGVSRPTTGRAISAVTPLVDRALREFVPVAEDLGPGRQYLADGALLPCWSWSWSGHRGLYSGKHKTTGLNVQVACTPEGRLCWVSDPVDGARHDVYCFDESGVLDTLDPGSWTGDKGYVGRGMVTPIKKTTHRDMLEWEHELSTGINGVRAAVERVIAHLKNWEVLHRDYRRPLTTFATTISAVVALHFYTMA